MVGEVESVGLGMTPGGLWTCTADLNLDTAHLLSNTAPGSVVVVEAEYNPVQMGQSEEQVDFGVELVEGDVGGV